MIYETYPCPDCSKVYTSKTTLKQHEYKKKHGRYKE